MMRMSRPLTLNRAHGFTLVEVLVSLFIMALLASMAWQGIDGIARSREAGKSRMERVLRLETVITQWEQDLAALQDAKVVPPIAFDGATVRLTRHTDEGMQLIAWSVRGGHWMRWSGPVVTHVAELQDSWLRSQQLLGNESGQLDVLSNIGGWQVYFYRENDNAWSNAQSSNDVTPNGNQDDEPHEEKPGPPRPRQQAPMGVRIVLSFAGQGQGKLTRDFMLGPRWPESTDQK